MTPEIWLSYVGTVLVFMIAPGPSHLLMLSNSLSNGFRRSIATAAGDLTANALQMILAGLGLASALAASERAFYAVKWLGVAYLIWLGVRQIWRSTQPQRILDEIAPMSGRKLWLQGFVTSAANPKAVVFFAGLFPLFIQPQSRLWPQIAILGATYIVIDGAFLLSYGRGADWLAARARSRSRAWIERIAGAGLIGAAVLLGAKAIR